MKRIRAAVISCGMIAKSDHLKAYKHFSEYYDVVAVCDVNIDAAKSASLEFSIPNFYTDAKVMLEKERPDVVSVCTPNMFHKEYTLLALNYGANVLCEKPLALTKSDAEEMFSLAKEKQKTLMACQSWRFMPERLAAKELIDDGTVGEVYFAELSRIRRRGIPTWGKFHLKEHSGGGAFLDIGVHVLDALIWLMGNPKPVAVTMNSHKVHCDEIGDLKKSGDLSGSIKKPIEFNHEEMNVESFAAGNIRFKNGASLNFKTAWAANREEENNIVLFGTDAGIDIEKRKVYIKEEEPATLEVADNRFPNESFYGHFYIIENMAKIILDGEKPLITPEETINLSSIIEAAYISAETNKTVLI